MDNAPILTIAIPTYNMGKYLPRNLESIVAAKCEAIETLILDNSSTDGSGRIADLYANKYPRLFTAIHKENQGYGSSVNWAIERAKGKYLRIIDADDWVDSEALADLVVQLKNQTADLVMMPYRIVCEKTGQEMIQFSAPREWKAGDIQLSFCEETCPVPQRHGTVFHTDFLRQTGVRLLENAYYVDEQLMLWTYMCAESACKLEADVYRYRIGNEMQSISSRSMGLHWYERECVIRSCLEQQRVLEKNGTLIRCCTLKLAENIGNHFTTLFIYVKPRKTGRRLANEWRKFIQGRFPNLWKLVKKKAWLLSIISFFHISPMLYGKIKKSSTLRRIVHT